MSLRAKVNSLSRVVKAWRAVFLAAAWCGTGAACRREPGASAAGGSAAGTSGAIQVTAITAERSGSHVHLAISLKSAAASGPGETEAVLLNGAGAPVPRFIAPGVHPPVIAAGAETVARWWLAPDDMAGALDLKAGGETLRVKAPEPFDSTALPEHKPVTLEFPRWAVKAQP